ncbi:MAG: HDOD domain-containing protein [Planctomycetota bacterium]|nr:HDOD domain-containing protein [Planctomycetota bacterium]
MLAEEVLIARQPIFDRANGLTAYELLFRPEHGALVDSASPEVATAVVSVRSVMDIGLDELVGPVRAWVNFSRTALTEEHFRVLPPERVVLEVLESVVADAEVLRALRSARTAGYQIALDDYVLNERTAGLLEFADFVKLDMLGRSEAGLVDDLRSIARPGLRILAEKVETRAVHDAALDAGFHLFQGYYFARPDIVPGRRMPTDRNALLRLLSELQDPATTFERIETLIAADVGLGVRLLRHVNAVYFGVRERIESLRHAVVMLGTERLRTCVAMILMADLDGKPGELVTMALVRAHMCEKLGERMHGLPDRYFSVGLFSLLDAFVDRPLGEIVERLGLSKELSNALLLHEGALGDSLRAVEACERADWSALEGGSCSATDLRDCYLEALRWSGQVRSSLAAD